MGTHQEQRSGWPLEHLPEMGTYQGKPIKLADVEKKIPPGERDEVEVHLTDAQLAKIGAYIPAGDNILRPWRKQPIVTVDDATGRVLDAGDDGIAVTSVDVDAAPPLQTVEPKTRADLESLGFTDAGLEHAYRTATGKTVVLSGEDTPALQALRGRVWDEVKKAWAL